MPAFDAGDVLESLEWDFRKAGVKAHGIMPEPSDAQIGAFLDQMKKLYTDAKASGVLPDLGDNAGPDEVLDAIARLTGDSFVAFLAKFAEIMADLCSGKPTKEQLLALPLRVRVKFYGWVQSEVVSPEAGTGAGMAELKALPSAAAG